ncbi:hypothetical protein QL285_094724 [Trifolium repens]|nr:hypothetical protein QL285_094724 [Trifolium repens]
MVILTFSRVAVLRTLIQLYYHFTLSIPNGISSSLIWFRGSVSGLVLILSYPNSLNQVVVLLSEHTRLDMLHVPLYHVLYNFSGIDRNIKRVENRLDTTGSSTNELDSSVDELIVIR